MKVVIKILIGLVACIHSYILWFEMFAWETTGKKVFTSFSNDFFALTKDMAANQGLYNGFLAAGLIWTFFISDINWNKRVSLFFLSCVSIAGIYGACTVQTKILFTQAIPAIITIILILFRKSNI